MAQTNNTQSTDLTEEELDIENLDFEPIEAEEYISEPAKELDVISVKREDTRGKLALAFLVGFFFILLSSLIIAAINEGDKISGAKEILLTVSGILSGPLGFVIGYYFRSSEEN